MRKKILILGLIAVGMLVSMCSYAVTFSDLSTEHWAYSYITSLVEKGIISGYPDGTYKPENTVSRAEFMKLIMAALHEGEGYFKSVEGEHWATPYFKEAEEKEYLMNGTEENDWDIEITRLEMANILAQVSIGNSIFNYSPLEEEIKFSDVETLGDMSKSYIEFITHNKFISGYPDGTFGPDRTMTRAECATIISRFIDVKEKMGRMNGGYDD